MGGGNDGRCDGSPPSLTLRRSALVGLHSSIHWPAPSPTPSSSLTATPQLPLLRSPSSSPVVLNSRSGRRAYSQVVSLRLVARSPQFLCCPLFYVHSHEVDKRSPRLSPPRSFAPTQTRPFLRRLSDT
ncbi:RHTO0S02e04478g1_1 [Rhodotorula toruloides]|uniref:RHTO0S02e04478g1_1 n=1 Tax=Rhodotorula toruloides TaxID=5286 RepID=A0A061APF5_RHOTO|nr:RHTO0S02e04478g1_1 [Rhodotorula toruloides]